MHATHPLLRRWEQLQFLFRTKVAFPRYIRRQMQRLARKRTPILLGPWLSEVGFELLYWIPFVRHFFKTYHIAPERVIAISRGGSAPWYSDVARGYFEIFDLYSPQDFFTHNRQREVSGGVKKQMTLSDFDRSILDQAATRLDLGEHDVVHPFWMYQLFSSYWGGWMHIERLCSWCDHSLLPINLPLPEGIPFRGEYAAVKFYFSDCFPDAPANRTFIRTLLERVAARMPVVLLNTGIKVDDHDDVGGQRAANVFDATPLMRPANNLTVQTAIVGNARLLLSTYGGFSYLGPLLNKPTLSFYSTPNFLGSHLQLAHEVLNRDAHQFLAVLPTGSVDLLCDLCGARALRVA
jgi:hypothetical protein